MPLSLGHALRVWLPLQWSHLCRYRQGILVDHNPAKAPELIAYQAIITSASRPYPLHAWLNYDTQFCITAASDRTLR